MTDEVLLEFHDHSAPEESRRWREAAAVTPRCRACGHHPNAHAKSGCAINVERPSSRNAKCGCAAVKIAA